MDYVLKEAQRLQSTQKLTQTQLLDQLQLNPNLPSFKPEALLQRLESLPPTQSKLALYIDDQDHLNIIQEIYTQILSQPEGLNYQQLQKSLHNKLNLNQISHYCRKLYNYNFVDITCKSHFKQVIARKYCTPSRPNQIVIEPQETEQPNYYRELNFLTNLWVNLGETLRLQELMARMDKLEENKSFPRLFEILIKENSISQQAERIGKVFTYKYQAKQPIAKWPYNGEKCVKITRGTNVIAFNQDTLIELHTLLERMGKECQCTNDDVARVLNAIPEESQRTKRKTQLSRSKINRYAIICNYLQEQRIGNVKDLKQQISKAEEGENVGLIDTRTIRNYLNVLCTVGFCKMHQVVAKVVQKECQRLLVSHYSVRDDDKGLQQAKLELQDIKEYKLQGNCKYSEDEESAPVKKQQRTHISKQLISNINIKNEVYMSDDDHIQMPKIEYHCTLFGECLNKVVAAANRREFRSAFTKLKPIYDREVTNEVFKRNKPVDCLSYLLGIEHKIKQDIREVGSFEDWEKDTVQYNQLQNMQINDLDEDSINQMEFDLCQAYQKEYHPKQQLLQTTEHLKNYLLRQPNISIHKVQQTFPQLNVYVLLHKLISDGTIDLYIGSQIKESLETVLYTKIPLEKVFIKVNSKYLIYFI